MQDEQQDVWDEHKESGLTGDQYESVLEWRGAYQDADEFNDQPFDEAVEIIDALFDKIQEHRRTIDRQRGEIEEREKDIEALREGYRKFYHADGRWELLATEDEVTARRIEAACTIDRLRGLVRSCLAILQNAELAPIQWREARPLIADLRRALTPPTTEGGNE